MPKIFISHSSKDNIFAKQLADALIARGAEVWIDLSDIPAGKDWSDEVQAGLDECGLMILIVSPDAMASKHVGREWKYFDDENKPIIPVIWLPVEKPNFQLRRLQHVEFHGQDFDTAMVKLIAELARRGFALTSPPAPPRMPSSAWTGGETTDSPLPDTPRIAVTSPVGTRHASSAAPVADTRQFPIIVKPDWVGKIIPEPFEWCVVPAGNVTLVPRGFDGDYLKQKQPFDVSEFQIARYPITNAQFEIFVKAKDGWRDPNWWAYSDTAKAWRNKNAKSHDARFKTCADCPRENVAWYAAIAYTRWLSAKTGEKITLPSDQQWQRAAQGDDGRTYPWGDDWDARKCNSGESKLGKTTPVTAYPQGASPYGVLDMSGNVWEWCLTGLDNGVQDIRNKDQMRVIRGGSWLDENPTVLRSQHRDWDGSEYGSPYDGFRCTCSV